MTNKINWDRDRRRRQQDDYFRHTDYRVRFGHNPYEKHDRVAEKLDKKHPDGKSKRDLNTEAMKLASKLYKVLKVDPLFCNDSKEELWKLAVNESKKQIKNLRNTHP